MSAPVNMVTSVNMHVTSKVTRPGMASSPSQKLNHDNITTSDDGAKVCIKWCPEKGGEEFLMIFIYCQKRSPGPNSQLITYLALEAEIDGQAWEISIFFWHVSIGLL